MYRSKYREDVREVEVWRGERRKEEEPVEDSGCRLSFRVAADRSERPPEGDAPLLWDDVFPQVVYLEDDEAQDCRLAEEHEVGGQEEERS